MRLSAVQKQIILDVARANFGETVSVRLFGSRIDDNERGGDIDLLVECQQPVENKVEKKCRMAAQIQKQLGEQKIDILVLDANTALNSVYAHAQQTGVQL